MIPVSFPAWPLYTAVAGGFVLGATLIVGFTWAIAYLEDTPPGERKPPPSSGSA
jgi:hypothetical protein